MRFKYTEFQGRFLPIIPIRIKGGDGWVNFRAFVDSGAGYSVFHAEMAEILGLKLEDGKREGITVGDGSQIEVYKHKVKVNVANQEFDATIGFSRQLGIGFNIIGRLSIFEKFKICFDESEQTVEFFQKPNNSK
jgi:predicted aspartyl protease